MLAGDGALPPPPPPEDPAVDPAAAAAGAGAVRAGANCLGFGTNSSWPIESLFGSDMVRFAAIKSATSTLYWSAMSSSVSLLSTVWITPLARAGVGAGDA